jgi:hypothetical protein
VACLRETKIGTLSCCAQTRISSNWFLVQLHFLFVSLCKALCNARERNGSSLETSTESSESRHFLTERKGRDWADIRGCWAIKFDKITNLLSTVTTTQEREESRERFES